MNNKIKNETHRKAINLVFKESKRLKRNSSKLGGLPYFTEDMKYPLSSAGEPMSFLLQISLGEINAETLLPKTGLLQFYIENGGRLECKVLYIKEPQGEAELIRRLPAEKAFPVLRECKITFEVAEESEGENDGSKLFGYPCFVQDDPREETDDRILLLQLDSDNENIIWGDYGVGNFFIRKSELEGLCFNKVKYYWDCY